MPATLKLTDKPATLTVVVSPEIVTAGGLMRVELVDARGAVSGYWCEATPNRDGDGITFHRDDRMEVSYRVRLWQGRPTDCTCPDRSHRGRTCKHMAAAPAVVSETF